MRRLFFQNSTGLVSEYSEIGLPTLERLATRSRCRVPFRRAIMIVHQVARFASREDLTCRVEDTGEA